MATDTARDIAGRIGLDLVEISPTAQPPVCKIMDYGRYKYELKKKEASAKKSQHRSQVKEVKFRPQISQHDLDFKVKNARRFLFDGDKVKCTVMFRGREIVHAQAGRELLKGVLERLSDVATQEIAPQMEGRTLSFTLAPNRAAIEKLKAKAAREEAAEAQEDQGAEET
jgi:translation initiation factor IF-3